MGMEIEHNNKWVCMKRTDDNYFNINGLGEIKFPKRFRITSISGEQLVTTLPGIKNEENIPTEIQYSGFKPGMYIWEKKIIPWEGESFNPCYNTGFGAGKTKRNYWLCREEGSWN